MLQQQDPLPNSKKILSKRQLLKPVGSYPVRKYGHRDKTLTAANE